MTNKSTPLGSALRAAAVCVCTSWFAACGGASASAATSSAEVGPPREADDGAPTFVSANLVAANRATPMLYRREGSDWIVVPSLRIAFRVPAGWHFFPEGAEVANARDNMDGRVANLMEEVTRDGGSPQLTFVERLPDSGPGAIPTLKMSVERLSAEDAEVTPTQYCVAVADLVRSQIAPDARVVANAATSVAGRRAHRCDTEYTLPARVGELAVRSEALTVFGDEPGLQLTVGSSASPSATVTGLATILDSMRRIEVR